MWDDGLPYHSVKYGIIASSTRESRGVVEIWSKKMCANGNPRLLLHLELGHLVPDELDVSLLFLRQELEHRPDRRILHFLRGLLVLPEVLHLEPERQAQHLFHRPLCHLGSSRPGFGDLPTIAHPAPGRPCRSRPYDWENRLFVSSFSPYNIRCTKRECRSTPGTGRPTPFRRLFGRHGGEPRGCPHPHQNPHRPR